MKRSLSISALLIPVILVISGYIFYKTKVNDYNQNSFTSEENLIESSNNSETHDEPQNDSPDAFVTTDEDRELHKKVTSNIDYLGVVSETSSTTEMLLREFDTWYEKVVKTGKASDANIAELQVFRDKFNSLPDEEKAKLVYYGQLDEDKIKQLNLDLNPTAFISLQNYRYPILATLENSSSSSKNSFTNRSAEIGVSLSHSDRDAFVTYIYSDDGKFAGIINLKNQPEPVRFKLEEIYGVDMRLFGGTVNYLLSDLRAPATFYVLGRNLNYAQVRLEEINVAEPLTRMEFPISSSTVVAVRLEMIDGVLHIGKWNFDFDGDDKTDLTLSNSEEFTDEHLKIAMEVMSNDNKLSNAEREAIRAGVLIVR